MPEFQTLPRLAFILITFSLLLSCATTSEQAYKLYAGEIRPDAEIVTLKFGKRVHEIIIDDMKVKRTDFGTIKINAGLHEIKWGADFIVSVLVNSSGFDSTATTETVELEAGHSYTINADRTTGHGYGMYLWVSDDNSGSIVAGTKKP